nr:hypothetical protein [Tanacetum cinerariifolium]
PVLAHRHRNAPPQAARRPRQGNLAAQQGEQQPPNPGQRPHRAGQPARQEGESIATLQPEAPLLAAELYVRAMDVPLIQRGRTVRLQFEGFPAIQFSGWPSAAVGTFGGMVTVIDVVNSPGGKYRLL